MKNDCRFLRFTLVGGIGFLVDSSILIFLTSGMYINPYLARVVSYMSAVTATWLLNRSYTFVVFSHKNKGREYIKYLSVSFLGGIVNWGVYTACLQLGGYCYQFPVLALMIASIIAMLVNFCLYRYYVFTATVEHERS